jgi:hypothetical protein
MPQSQQISTIIAMMKSHNLATDQGDVNTTFGSTQAYCGSMEASGASGGTVAIDGIYG